MKRLHNHTLLHMCLHMSFQPCRCREALITQLTAVWLLTSVHSDVHVEVRGAPEPPVTIGAGIRLFSCVDPFVKEELTRSEEGLLTLGALVRPFPSVSQVMPDERCRLGKPLATPGAFEWTLTRVCVEVLTLSSLGFKALGALWTAKGL